MSVRNPDCSVPSMLPMVVCSTAMCPAGDWTPAAEVWSAPACYLPSAARGQLTGAAAAEALLREVSEKKLTADRLWAEIISCSDEACEEVRLFLPSRRSPAA